METTDALETLRRVETSLLAEMRELNAETLRHMDAAAERLRADIRSVGEGIALLHVKIDALARARTR